MNALTPKVILEPAGERQTIRVTGVFDMAAVLRLADSLKEAVGDVDLHIDLRLARETHDAAVVALANVLCGRRAIIQGLSRHHERLLRYFGHETQTQEEVRDGDESRGVSVLDGAVGPEAGEASATPAPRRRRRHVETRRQRD